MDSVSQPQQSPSPRRHFLNKKFIITLAILILAAADGYSYILQTRSDTALQEAIPTFTPRAEITADWKNYTDNQFGFQIFLTDIWRGYKVLKKSDTVNPTVTYIYFQVSSASEGLGYAAPFAISVYPADVYSKLQKEPGSGLLGALITQNGKYVFTYNHWQDPPQDLINTDFQVEKIISTFKFTDSVQGMHCGGNIKDAPTCPSGYTCKLNISLPDTGGTCQKN